jgi:hypothetical protein
MITVTFNLQEFETINSQGTGDSRCVFCGFLTLIFIFVHHKRLYLPGSGGSGNLSIFTIKLVYFVFDLP